MSPIEPALASGEIYQDATYKYFGEAAPGTPLTTANWRVSRMALVGSRIQWVDSGRFTQVYTDVSVVAALAFA